MIDIDPVVLTITLQSTLGHAKRNGPVELGRGGQVERQDVFERFLGSDGDGLGLSDDFLPGYGGYDLFERASSDVLSLSSGCDEARRTLHDRSRG